MLGLKLREEFAGKRLSGTTIDFSNSRRTGALDRSAADFLAITYPSIDLLKTLQAVQPGTTQPVVIIGSRGQGKSHLMAALSHMLTDHAAGRAWLDEWGGSLKNETLRGLALRGGMAILTESLHLHNYKFLWDLLFDRHPAGTYIRGKWEGQGEGRTEIPGYNLILELLQKQPTALILDEFQTWYEGLTNTKQFPWRNWAFNFIQILSEIAERQPELLMLVVSVREGNSDAAQQIYRVNPVRIDFKGPQAKQDRRRLLLYRVFENRLHVPTADIEKLIAIHTDEFLRIHHIPGPDHDRHRAELTEAWPFSPRLLQLLDDQVLIAVDAQETRDLLRILVDVFKTAKDTSPVITAADFSITNDRSGVASLLDSVASQLHRDLREKAQRNLEAVSDAVRSTGQPVPHLEEILSALWLRSLSLENLAGAEPADLHVDITRHRTIDDNQFQVELDLIEQNSFNIHRRGGRLVFLNEENAAAKLMAHAHNDRLFEDGEHKGQDLNHLASEIRYMLAGAESESQLYRVIVLRKSWQRDPWAEVDEKDRPDHWDSRMPVVVIPSSSVNDADLGRWLKQHVATRRNTVRFLLPKKDTAPVFADKAVLVLTRAVYLSEQWKKSDTAYQPLHLKYQKELREQLKTRFDRFAVLETWSFGAPEKCTFHVEAHNAEGARILNAVQEAVRRDLFDLEEFEALALESAKASRSVAQLLDQLREPRQNGEPSIPWLGETEAREQTVRLCARGLIAINLGREWLQTQPGEPEEAAWNRMKGRLPSGRQLEEVSLHEPETAVTSGGGQTATGPGQTASDVASTTTATPGGLTGKAGVPSGLFTDSGVRQRVRLSSPPTSSLNLLGKLESWGINAGTSVHDVKLLVGQLTGAQLEQLLRKLPDGVTYGIDLERE